MEENIVSDKTIGESGASNSNATTQTAQSNLRKTRKKRSVAWDHFDEIVDSEGNTKGKCRHCQTEYFADTKGHGTTTMLTHLPKCPKIPFKFETKQAKLVFQPVHGGNKGEMTVANWKFDQEQCRRALCQMVIVDELPFSFVEKEGFKKFMKVAQPFFRIPSRSTVTRDCFSLFNEEKKNLIKFFKDTQQRVCITTDTWTSIQRINYMCITAHWIDNEWTMHKRIINFCPISSHRGEDMAKAIGKCLLEWGLQKIFTITVDNAGSNDVTARELSKQLTKWGTNSMKGQHLHMRCMAHIINLIVQDGIKSSNVSVERVRQAVRYIRQSPARWKKFQECCEDENLVKKSLCLDVPTRWNSTYLMLSRAIEYESAITDYADRDIGLGNHLEFLVDEVYGDATGKLLSSDWEQVKRIAKFLEMFYKLTLRVSGSLYVTSNSHFLEIAEIAVCLKRLISSEDKLLGSMAKTMNEKFIKYWGEPERMNKMIFISCVLDPRHKFDTVSFALGKMFGDKGPTLEKAVHTYMTSLFDEYQKSHSNDKGSQVSSTVSSSSLDTVETSSSDVPSLFEELMRHKAGSGSIDSKTELEKYLAEGVEKVRADFNILSWWKVNSPRFPILAEIARDVLAIPISSVASECAFSTGGRILDSFRSSLTPKLVEALVCLQDWLRSESLPVSVEEDLDNLEKLEEDFAKLGKELCIDEV